MQNCKMKIFWIISVIICQFMSKVSSYYTEQKVWIEQPHERFYSYDMRQHYPDLFTTPITPYVNATDIRVHPIVDTPDYRLEEPPFIPKTKSYIEYDRPYLNSPAYKQYLYAKAERKKVNLIHEMACYCNTVYRKFTLLAGCAVITSQHVLTTATPTMLVIRSYRHEPHLDGIFGGWYDINVNSFNSSIYFQASRIHVHPKYVYDYEVNVSHPIPAMYDLALITLQIKTYKDFSRYSYLAVGPYICSRAGSKSMKLGYASTVPASYHVAILAGFQFAKSFNRKPMPWFRYIVHTRDNIFPCPKSDWHWYHCLAGQLWAKYGFDSGGGMNSAWLTNWRYDGFTGMCAFSLKLRSKQMVHYFTVVDNHPVLDFLYDAMLGLIRNVWLDDRFQDTKWRTPVPWAGEHIDHSYNVPGYSPIENYKHIPMF